jgi:hypothetical protein
MSDLLQKFGVKELRDNEEEATMKETISLSGKQ